MAVDREHVLRSAAALLTRKSTATMDEVAKAAGISRATLHRHFAGRDALVRALEALGIEECEAALAAARPAEGPARDAVRRLVREIEPAAGLLAFLYTENQLFEGEEQHEGWARIDAGVAALFKRGQAAGEFRIDLTPAWLTEALYGLLASGAWAVSEGRVAPNDFTFMITELLLGGALRHPERPAHPDQPGHPDHSVSVRPREES
ncbi:MULTISPECIES: TetR/AcrR family transcriptional regulator [Streptomyces]|uniref:Helix-turn-helix domain containing protein n=1 Tax=Streptomyces griseiscabiei TaxID=2993540 RepID=A0ABU4L9M3_9ACTN|nr:MULTISPECIES: TetR/AcrR family transcriptional regulator [Streptomyces]MBZ3902471.1 TetR/AcrR family transcriptional regulator [Streptomyces griseiscabiei]MDX2912151.1 helix-turn-helix domain containing protein [Streptomyces griseiscabiei]